MIGIHTIIRMDTVALVLDLRSCIVCSSNIFNALRSGGGETVRQPELPGDCSRDELTVWAVQFIDAYRCEAYRCRDVMPKQCSWANISVAKYHAM
jgi:hypothetical protein